MKDPTRWRDLDGGAPDHVRALLRQAQGAPPPLPEAVRAASAAAVLKATGAWTLKTAMAVKFLAALVVVAGTSAVVVRSRHVSVHAPHVTRALRPPTPRPAPSSAATDAVHPAMSAVHDPHAGAPHDATSPAHHPVDPDAESAPLERARAALAGGDVALAVATLHDHARRFPQSALSEERDYLTFRANTRDATPEGVAREADRFLLRHPHGIYSAQVRAQRGGEP